MTVKVLIIEDNPVARSFLCRVVRESFSDAMEITEVGDLENARRQVAKIDGSAPDGGFKLVLVDLELPDGNGMEFLTELAGSTAIKIVTTLYSDDDHLFPALQCGADGYLLKEDRFEVLVEELQRIVRGQPPLSPSMARRMQGFLRAQNLPEGDARALTPRESEVLLQISKGFTVKEIARLMGMKGQMVNEHIRGAYRKLALASTPQQALLAGATLDT